MQKSENIKQHDIISICEQNVDDDSKQQEPTWHLDIENSERH